MTEEDLIKLFEDVPITHVFRHWSTLAKDDIAKLRTILQKEFDEITQVDFDDAEKICSRHWNYLFSIIANGKKDNPYQTVLISDIEHATLPDYLSKLNKETFFTDIKWSFSTHLGALLGYCRFIALNLSTNTIDNTILHKDLNEARDSLMRFEAVLDATANYEEQLFG